MLYLILLLLIISYQDFNARAISWWTIPLLLGIVLYIRFYNFYSETWWQESAFNFSFLLIQFILITLYFSIKKKTFTNIIDRHLGLGDILFLIPLALLFSPLSFLLFYILSILFVLLGFLFYKSIFRSETETIPLAGGQALFLIALLISSKVFDFSLINPFFLPLGIF